MPTPSCPCARADELVDSPQSATLRERVHVWVRVGGDTEGTDAQDTASASAVEVNEVEKRVSVVDGSGARLATAIVDGVLTPSELRQRQHADAVLSPLVQFVAIGDADALDDPIARPKSRCSVLLCYGVAEAGRGECILGADGLGLAAARNMLGSRAAGVELSYAAVLITMELVVDLLNPAAEVAVAETQ